MMTIFAETRARRFHRRDRSTVRRGYRETDATIHSGSAYHLLSAGYALELLGARLRHPIAAIHEIDAAALLATLNGLP